MMVTGVMKPKVLKPRHVIFLAQNVMVAYNLLVFPHTLSPAGHNEWIPLLLMAIVSQLMLIPMVRLGLKYPDWTLYEINENLLGVFLGKVLNLAITLFGILQFAGVTTGYFTLIYTVTLPRASRFLPVLALIAVATYIVFGGIKLIARTCILAFFFTIWTIYLLRWTWTDGELANLFPLYGLHSFQDIMKAFNDGFPAMFGYELIPFFFPYIINQKKALLHVSMGMWITVLVYLTFVLASIIFFSEWQLSHVRYPILDIFNSVELSFVERIENLGVALWVFLVLSTTAAYLWLSVKGVNQLFKRKRNWHVYICVVIAMVLIISGLFSPVILNAAYESIGRYAGYLLILWPSLMLGLHKLKKRGS